MNGFKIIIYYTTFRLTIELLPQNPQPSHEIRFDRGRLQKNSQSRGKLLETNNYITKFLFKYLIFGFFFSQVDYTNAVPSA